MGTNFWYGAILGSKGQGGNRERLIRELDFMNANGIDNLRILIGADGENGVPSKVEPTLQTAPGVYNDSIFDGLDFLLAEMGKRDMKAVLYFTNSWEWSGGYSQYLNWAGKGKNPVPSVDGWPAYMDYVKQYATCNECHEMLKKHIEKVITRTNTYTGKKYSDDPAIFSIGANQNAQVIDAVCIHEVEFTNQPFAIAALTFRAEYCAIPKVGSYKVIRLIVEHKLIVFNAYKFAVSFRTAGKNYQEKYG